ncbi:beta-ketoacyl synthase N-terminal-like domain-containing protein [Lentzea sp. CC55]|uniref:type I polyketide synthase n=1 Tax=Lentzea sp. CC55 TaxID=2884909 RepID=UPI0027E0F867|nr:beta-ketoacyl synthase N-terminal-like domain-containing protein [Lentzea sp. CC55]
MTHRPASTRPGSTSREVAVAGMSCRFPGAGSVAEFWDLLTGGVDAVSEIPRDRFDIDDWYSTEPAPGRTISRHGGFLADVRGFDAEFFGISPREARAMDPQQRLLLEVAWEALEDAGIRPSGLAGRRVGVFVGQATAEYGKASRNAGNHDVRHAAGGELRAVTSGRLSYALDLRGPSVVVDTACSSSLVAVHNARQALLAGECDVAIAAGVNVILLPDDAIAYSQASMLAPDGRCKFGSARADGFVRSEGIGAVVLERLDDAVEHGDRVHAVLLGSAVSNDGRGSGLLLQPAVHGQAEMLEAAYRDAGLKPSTVDYIEAHGTGTSVGDRVELAALREIAGEGREKPLLLGSVKSNIGHTEAAAGVAGLIKAVLIAEHRTVPASLHAHVPAEGLADGPLRLVTRNQPLTAEQPIVGVSSFGISGTNVHVVLTSPPDPVSTADDDRPRVLALSAKSVTALRDAATAYLSHLDGTGAVHDTCYTAAVRRDHHEHRLAVTGTSTAEFRSELRAFLAGETSPGRASERPQVVFQFPGQGSQWRGMGRELYEVSPAFRAALDECDAAVRDEAGWSVVDVLTGAAPWQETIQVIQPVLWAVQVALAAHWRSWGVHPDVVVGHSMGEVAAAQVAGALSTRDAAAVICRRSALMQETAGSGAMLWAELSAAHAEGLLRRYRGEVCVAADNSPGTCVLAGPVELMKTVAEDLSSLGVAHRPVKDVDVASHSPLMDEVAAALREQLDALRPEAPRIDFRSTVDDGRRELDARYWADNVRRTVRLNDTMRRILTDSRHTVVLEISPHPVLLAAVGEIGEAVTVPSLLRGEPELRTITRALGHLHTAGVPIDWASWFGGGRCVPLPAYPWQHQEYWFESFTEDTELVREVDAAALGIGEALKGLRFRGLTPLPCAALFEAVLSVARGTGTSAAHALKNVRFHELCTVDPESLPTLTVALRPERGGVRAFTVHTGEGLLLASGELERGGSISTVELDWAFERCREYVRDSDFRELAARHGYEFEGPFRSLRQAWRGQDMAVARFGAAGSGPVALETGMQTVMLALGSSAIPLGVDRVRITGRATGEFWAVARRRRGKPVVDVRLYDDRHDCFAELTGITVRTGASAPFGRLTELVSSVTNLLRSARTPAPLPERTPTRREEPVVVQQPGEPVREVVLGHVAAVLGTTPDRLDTRRALRDLGLDSLMAAQLAARLKKSLGRTVPATQLLGPEDVGALADSLT